MFAVPVPPPPPRPAVVTVVATDFAFQLPDTIAAGPTTIRLLNQGKELHHVQLVRLDAGHTAAEYLEAMGRTMKGEAPPPAWATEVGGPNTPVPGGETRASLVLKPGTYAIVCFIPSADHVPHVAKGMSKQFVVAGSERAASARPASAAEGKAEPAPAATMTLDDYSFTLSKPLTAGRRTIRVRNAAAQSHEVVMFRLMPGRTVRDFAAWAEKLEGPPPAVPVGGTSGLAKGEWNDVHLDLEPGKYGLVCFVPDAKDGRMHLAHGMLSEFEVAAK